uniref:N-acetyltransferase domain-containing protein n=1 Tax=Heliothis virescens TaxID=7102 RepID=A0A2A4K277_HELVI
MFRLMLTKLGPPTLIKHVAQTSHYKQCHSVFGIMDLIHQEKPEHFALSQVTSESHDVAVHLIKRYFLSEHVLVRARNMDISNDCALDEYLISLLKQGNSLFAKAEDGTVAGLCVSFASSPVDPKNLRNYAFYRQDPNTKDFLYFTAKLQETPNLWEVFKQQKIFEIKMITVLPEFRRQGLAVFMAEKSIELARDQGYNVIRMDCINPYDYKIAERCMLQCLVKFPLHKVRGANAPFIKRSSEFNRCVRVYVEARSQPDVDRTTVRSRRQDLESLIE